MNDTLYIRQNNSDTKHSKEFGKKKKKPRVSMSVIGNVRGCMPFAQQKIND